MQKVEKEPEEVADEEVTELVVEKEPDEVEDERIVGPLK